MTIRGRQLAGREMPTRDREYVRQMSTVAAAAIRRAPRASRDVLVWLHVVSSVGWMTLALTLLVLLLAGSSGSGPGLGAAAFRAAEHIDKQLLLYMANASAFTGLMLSGLTPWGYFRSWWVLVKLLITLTQLYAGIFLLSPSLHALTAAPPPAAEAGATLVVASGLMASAIAFQAWLGIAKPWPATPWTTDARRRRVWMGGRTMYALAVAAPFVDVLVARLAGHPAPLLEVSVAALYPAWRSWRSGRREPPTPPAPPPGGSDAG